MTTKVVPGQLVAGGDAREVAQEAATRIARALRSATARNGRATLALSGGNTPREAYALLAREPIVEWAKVSIFWIDERAVPPTDDRSNYRWTKATLLDSAGVPSEHVYRMRAEAPDLDGAAREYERLIREWVEVDADGLPAFDVAVLGIGEDGHTASLFPGDPAVDVVDRLVVPVAAKEEREARLTVTPPILEHARHLFILAVGPAKREPLERAWATQGDVHRTPARVVRGCRGAVTWVIDKVAGGLA
jgi:6-phosphogluconolactonase